MKLCNCCGRVHTLADMMRSVWGFQRFNGFPELATLALFDCSCESTLAIELPNPTWKETTHAA